MIESLYNMQAMKALKKFTHFIIDFFLHIVMKLGTLIEGQSIKFPVKLLMDRL